MDLDDMIFVAEHRGDHPTMNEIDGSCIIEA